MDEEGEGRGAQPLVSRGVWSSSSSLCSSGGCFRSTRSPLSASRSLCGLVRMVPDFSLERCSDGAAAASPAMGPSCVSSAAADAVASWSWSWLPFCADSSADCTASPPVPTMCSAEPVPSSSSQRAWERLATTSGAATTSAAGAGAAAASVSWLPLVVCWLWSPSPWPLAVCVSGGGAALSSGAGAGVGVLALRLALSASMSTGTASLSVGTALVFWNLAVPSSYLTGRGRGSSRWYLWGTSTVRVSVVNSAVLISLADDTPGSSTSTFRLVAGRNASDGRYLSAWA
mmetsp:Transcript_28741/g.82939  ORF Transcript_28741/g.82939 Transcript_28741/m.82939 type:complete len:287 (-) Transcript_28741:992-1852(-)